MPKINDVVRLISSLPSESLAEGAIGVIVAEFDKPDKAFEVEFSDTTGSTVAQLAMTPDKFVVIR